VKAGVHKHLVLAKVIETADKKLDVDVAMSQLVKYEGQSSAFVEACKMLHGAECAHKPKLESKCDKALDNGPSSSLWELQSLNMRTNRSLFLTVRFQAPVHAARTMYYSRQDDFRERPDVQYCVQQL
jgi:hypothetical protein